MDSRQSFTPRGGKVPAEDDPRQWYPGSGGTLPTSITALAALTQIPVDLLGDNMDVLSQFFDWAGDGLMANLEIARLRKTLVARKMSGARGAVVRHHGRNADR